MTARPTIRKQLYLLIIGLLVGAAFTLITLFGFPTQGADPAPTATGGPDSGGLSVAPVVGSLAPAWTLESVDAGEVSLQDYQGQTVLLNFWAVWCGPCVVEMPLLQARYEDYAGKGLVVLGINFDDPVEDVKIFKESLGLTFPILLDPGGKIQDLYRIRGYPSSIFVDPDGVIQVVHIGIMTEGQLDGYLEDVGL
jgi:peroxiredoxin